MIKKWQFFNGGLLIEATPQEITGKLYKNMAITQCCRQMFPGDIIWKLGE